MCGRYIRKILADDAIRHFELVDGLKYFDTYQPTEEQFPGEYIFSVNKFHQPEDVWWTINVNTYGGKTYPAINAKAENVLRVSDFKNGFLNDRILIPATGLYEWQTPEGSKKKLKYEIYFEEPIFAFGGLAADSLIKGETRRCGVIITTYPNKIFSLIHNVKQRQAVVIRAKDYEKWLDPKTPMDVLQELMKPLPDEETHYKLAGPPPEQGGLFG